MAISLFAVSILSGCNPAYYDPIVPEVLVGQGVHRDGGTCYFMIIWEIDTEPHYPEHFRNWGYRIRVENSGEEFLKEEYKTIEEVLVRKMPGANWKYDEDSQCWLVPCIVLKIVYRRCIEEALMSASARGGHYRPAG